MTDKVLISEELTRSMSELPKVEPHLREGDKGLLKVYLAHSIADSEVAEIGENIKNKGVVLTEPIRQEVRSLYIRFQKLLAPLAIIASAISSAGISILGWQLFKTTPTGIPIWVWGVGIAAIAILSVGKTKRRKRYVDRSSSSITT